MATLIARDFAGRSPLQLAAAAGYTHTMRLLLSFHPNLLNQRDRNGDTALHYAARANQPRACHLLLSANCEYARNADDYLPLDLCIEMRHSESAAVHVQHERFARFLLG